MTGPEKGKKSALGDPSTPGWGAPAHGSHGHSAVGRATAWAAPDLGVGWGWEPQSEPRTAPSWASGEGLARGTMWLLWGPLHPTRPPGTGRASALGAAAFLGMWFPECLWEPVRSGAPESVELSRGAVRRAGGPGAGRGQPGVAEAVPPRAGRGPSPLKLRSHFSHLNFEHKL